MANGTDTQSERLRVLKMLEEGKINAEECAELLAAIDQPPAILPSKRTHPQWGLAAVGAVLILIGFWLPWIVIDSGLVSARLSGGDMPHFLGWFVLAFGLGAALLPHWKPGVFVLTLGIGILGYLTFNNSGQFSNLDFGMLLVFFGYLSEFSAIFYERFGRNFVLTMLGLMLFIILIFFIVKLSRGV